MRRTKAQAQETREALLLAALETFHQRGVARASLHEIAQAAGVTRGALYWHFKNKGELFDALFLRIFCEFSQRLDEDIRDNAPGLLQTLRQALVNMFERLEHNDVHRKFCHILHLKCEHIEDNAAILEVIKRYHLMWKEQIHAALGLCTRQGALPADLDLSMAAAYLKSALFGFMRLYLEQPERFGPGQTAPRLVDATLYALQHSPTLRLTAAPQA